jgi:hypothetical protein
MQLNIPNITYLNIVKRQIITYQDKENLHDLKSPEVDEVPQLMVQQHHMSQFNESNYIMPL